ncbi:MAG TPA: nitrate reductase molybdenum cofactor assembly chaperone [Paracoccus sp.]|nr:nitrate reductase molybdenum cofactor assembly chaperone [Paracoccus sp. (in: a-proteobacteria)]
MKTFKVFSLLLSYPSAEMQQAIPAMQRVLQQDGLVGPARFQALSVLMKGLQDGDLYDLQERYVLLFDRSRSLSLNLFEHIHGESRDRGGAMVDLLEMYRAGGLDLDGVELPDHLPVLLEYLSTRPLAEAQTVLEDAGHILVALSQRLARRDTPYAAVIDALVVIAQASDTSEEARALLDLKDDDPEDLEALDAVWEEAQVTFGPDPNAGCPISRDLLARMDPAPAPPRARAAN